MISGFLATILAMLVTGCGLARTPDYDSLSEIASLGNYQEYTLQETLGSATPPFRRSNIMDTVLNAGARKSVYWVSHGTNIQHDLSHYPQELLVSFWENNQSETVILVMSRNATTGRKP